MHGGYTADKASYLVRPGIILNTNKNYTDPARLSCAPQTLKHELARDNNNPLRRTFMTRYCWKFTLLTQSNARASLSFKYQHRTVGTSHHRKFFLDDGSPCEVKQSDRDQSTRRLPDDTVERCDVSVGAGRPLHLAELSL